MLLGFETLNLKFYDLKLWKLTVPLLSPRAPPGSATGAPTGSALLISNSNNNDNNNNNNNNSNSNSYLYVYIYIYILIIIIIIETAAPPCSATGAPTASARGSWLVLLLLLLLLWLLWLLLLLVLLLLLLLLLSRYTIYYYYILLLCALSLFLVLSYTRVFSAETAQA